ncbi:beta-ketoacyl synthase N-terminal-like domain-containing protein [Nocardia sp. NPDC051990]|uniref:beta-ketoacyl synthase N-terminal-like domain-containing protein n=1 Tax=Nocardia sp. NPDC051990 TaxID=3155285 RepID=UPI0034316DE8
MTTSNVRVFVTGIGMISPAGFGAAAFWDDLRAGRRRFQEMPSLYAGMKPGTLGAFVPATAKEAAVSLLRTRDRTELPTASIFSTACALEALTNAGLRPGDNTVRNAVVCLGSSDGQAEILEAVVDGRRHSGSTAGRFNSYTIAEDLARVVGAAGLALTAHSTCASANVALAYAVDLLRDGFADIAIAGGCDTFSAKNIIGFSSLQAIGPSRCLPFSQDRRFVTPAEGAGVLVLQTERSVTERQQPLAEVLAVAVNNDASHPTATDKVGIAACHQLALDRAGLDPSDIGAVFAHGTGSRVNDMVEGEIFAERYPGTPITAIKGTVGHLMGGAGAAGTVAACLALADEFVPPTPVDPDRTELALNLITGAGLAKPGLRYVQSNAFGFGGNNAIAVLGRPA